MPARSSAGVYGEGAPGSQPVADAPAQVASNAAADAPAPATPTTWIRSSRAIGRGSRAAARPAPIEAPARTCVTRGRRRRARPGLQDCGRAVPFVRDAIAGPEVAA